MLYNIVLLSAIHQHESALGIHMSHPSWTSLPLSTPSHPFRLSAEHWFWLTETYSKSHWSSILHMVMYMFSCYSLHSSHPLLPSYCVHKFILYVCNSIQFSQFTSVTQSCLTLCDPINLSTSGLPVHHQLPEFTQTHFHRVSDAIQPSHPLLFPSPPALNPSQHESLFQWVSSSYEVAKVLGFQL